MSVVEKPFLHMLPEVYPLPDVRVFRFNIDSSWLPYWETGKIFMIRQQSLLSIADLLAIAILAQVEEYLL